MSHQLHVRPDGEAFIVTGDPTTGYTASHIEHTDPIGSFAHKYQATAAVRAWPDPDGAAR